MGQVQDGQQSLALIDNECMIELRITWIALQPPHQLCVVFDLKIEIRLAGFQMSRAPHD